MREPRAQCCGCELRALRPLHLRALRHEPRQRLCPSCFDRLSTDGRLGAATTRFRAYGSLAISSAIGSLIIFPLTGIPLGLLTIYYVVKGFRNRDNGATTTLGLVIALLLGLVGLGSGLFMLFTLVAPRFF